MSKAPVKMLKKTCGQVLQDYSNFTKTKDPSRRTKHYLSTRLTVLEDNFKSIRLNREVVLSTVEDETVVEDCEACYEKMMECYLLYKPELLEEIEALGVLAAGNKSSSVFDNSITASHRDIRLPKINIPSFSGTYETWRSYHDLFVSLIHNNTSLSEIEKLHYLKTSVTGEAERLLQHLKIDQGNYVQAWTILSSRYDHKRILVNTQLRILFDQAKIVSESSCAIKGLLDTSTEVLHSLRNLGVPVDHWDVMVIYVLLHKLPASTQQLWEEKLGMTKELPAFKEFCAFLETRFRTLEADDEQNTKPSTSQQKGPTKQKVFHVKPTHREQFTCKVCRKGQHSLRTCKGFINMQPEIKLRTVNQLGVCANCLAYSHKTQQCPSHRRCYFCQQNHHSLLHNTFQTNTNTFIHSPYVQAASHSNPTQFSHSTTQSTPFYPNTSSHSNVRTQNNTNTQAYQVSTQINPNAQVYLPPNETRSTLNNTNSQVVYPENQHSSTQNFHAHTDTQVLLATAIVKVRNSKAEYFNLRALIDTGSEATFITESAAQLLQLKGRSTYVEVSGLGKVSSGVCRKYVDIVFGSTHSTFETSTRALVIKSLTGLLPAKALTLNGWKHLSGLILADPYFNKPAAVDLLLGSDVFAEFVLPQIVRGHEPMTPIAQNTQLGWILLGKVPSNPQPTVRNFLQFSDVDTQLRKFWEMEEAPFHVTPNADDIACEKYYNDSTKRLSNGRYEVSLPFKDGCKPALGPSKQGALRRFHQLERRFQVDPTLHKEYAKCIQEYEDLEQMTEVDVNTDVVLNSPYHYFVPHHAVYKETSSTTKLRVVFDAAAKTVDGTSLNDHLMIGPKTQNSIIDIILGWRVYKYTFTADIEKMFRQIRMNQRDAYYQLIFWRKRPEDHLKVFRMDTVTFGTACAPYLANRTVKQVADDEGRFFPLAAKIVRTEMYVDDLISGADTLHETLQKRDEVRHLLSAAGLSLRKWTSNCDEVLQGIPLDQRELGFSLPFSNTEHVKALGIRWFPKDDSFAFQNIVVSDASVPTKRTMLSTIAKLFDPLGWISPCIIRAKIMMQQLWCRGLEWDQPLPSDLKRDWASFQQELPLIERIRIPRWIRLHGSQKEVHVHGFSDASERAYGAAIYIRILDEQDNIHVHLLMSKTKVAPLKTVTLPRLELCGAVMLATLLDYVVKTLGLENVRTYAWSDSEITLAWITSPPSKWKTFVSNRVSEIQRLTNCNIWGHVPTLHNPADLASRGILPTALNGNTLWWHGPEFLRSGWKFTTPAQPSANTTEEEKRKIHVHAINMNAKNDVITTLLEKYSDLRKLLRILTYCKRFILNYLAKSTSDRLLHPLTPTEIYEASIGLVTVIQGTMFSQELAEIKTNNLKCWSLKSLNAFMDQKGILRVGGRLHNANLGYDQKHPIILKPDHPFSKLLVKDAHERTFHGGVQQMIAYLRNRYWILNVKSAIRKFVHGCNICFRHRPKPSQQLMGNLPSPRVRISRPFSYTGVDYAGPIEVKAWKGRGAKTFKAYFAIFVCLSTKAIHIELVSDMTTQAFLAAFRRFSSRRGICKEMFSDCGKNFVGANTVLQKLLKTAAFNKREIFESVANDGTTWNFIPPASPHFGGLWEAGVKSVKYHLKRVTGNETLTFEELSTLLTQIEACLNSRPLCPLSDNPEDLSTLTPAHFLIGEPMRSIPQPDTADEGIGYNDRWQRLQKMYHTFWKQWSSEYLARLQHRPKWLNKEQQPKAGDLVLLKDERMPPSKWALARIVELHPGSDDLIRVVTLKTQNGEFRRPITKICPLPSNKAEPEDTLI